VAKAGPGPKLFQLYHHGDRTWVSDLLARVEASGYMSVCLTVDTQLYSRRERDIVNRYSPRQAMSVAPNPRGPDSTYPARLTWADVEWLQKTTRLPVGLKGIMTARDARRAVEMGVQVIWVSNHGGRQLDHTQATIAALPAIVDAVAGRAAIVIDGGFRRGTDVIKAVALGATVVAMGRTILWGLAADGADGVACALDILRQEIRTSMGLCGQTSMRTLPADLILPVDY
jgi:isopentenyl diphosphate isomerase/L-lactate dehydrogenase-like FMN-dependent dehydrogenase